jgi:FMN-dependent NADH-azoreductase
VVIGAPMYNFSVPTQLKAWIDRIAVAGKTFRYTEAGPEGLCGDKKVILVSTAGGLHQGQPTGVGMKTSSTSSGFIGITDVEPSVPGLAYGPEHRAKAIDAAQAQIAGELFAAA